MAQPVEPDEKPIDSQLNQSKSAKQLSLFSRTIVQPVKVEPQPIDPHLNRLRFGQEMVKSNDHFPSIKC